MYRGTAIRNSFLTPDMPVNVVEPVNWSAIYELAAGKKRQAAAKRPHACMKYDLRRCPANMTESAPAIQPFIAKDLNGMNGSMTGVINAPLNTATNPMSRKGLPPDHALLNITPDGSSPNNSSTARAKRG